MADFTGRAVENVYGGWIAVDNSNNGVDSTLRTIQDGKGHTTPCQVSSTYYNFTGLQYNGNILNFGAAVTTVGAISTGGAITTAGAFTISGAFGTTLTVTALTSITLPTTGTLSTLNGTETLVNKTLTSPTLTTPHFSSIINTGTLTLPTSTDTLVGRGTTDTLTNKTLTSPTITNPTLTSPALGTPASGTLTNCIGYKFANLDVVVGGALPIANGGTASTTAANARSNLGITLELISTVTASSQSFITFTNLSTTYNTYKILISNMVCASSGGHVAMQISTDNGSSWFGGTGYKYAFTGRDSSGTALAANNNGTNLIAISNADSSNADGYSGEFILHNPFGSQKFVCTFQGSYLNNTNKACSIAGTGINIDTTNINAVRIFFNGLTTASGTIKLYGFK